jgi:rhamnosyltransferase
MTATAGVIVTFYPDADLDHRVQAIAREVDRLLVVDNSADASVTVKLRETVALYGGSLVAMPTNVGLGRALNYAFSQVAADGYEWAVAFDQDSTPQAGFTAALHKAAAAHSGAAVVGANWFDEARPGTPSRHLHAGVFPLFFRRGPAEQDLSDITCVITSGTLFDLRVWRTLGGFDERLFLDLVDTEYCLRARRADYQITVAAAARMTHRRGSKQPVRLLGRTWWPAFMPPSRLYYLFRNRVRVTARHGRSTPHWVLFEAVYATKILF